MRTLTGFIIGVTLMIIWHILGWPFIGWVFTRNLPPTPDGWQPRVRVWRRDSNPWPISASHGPLKLVAHAREWVLL